MHFTTSIATLISMVTMAIGSHATSTFRSDGFAKVTRSDPYVGDYRVWGEPGCSAQNLGVGTVTESGLDTCKNFGDIVKAVNLTNVVDGCTFFVYSEIHCEGIRESIKKGSGCGNAIDVVWSSYQFTCDPIVPGN